MVSVSKLSRVSLSPYFLYLGNYGNTRADQLARQAVDQRLQLEQEIGQAAVARYVDEQEESCEEEYFDSDEEECYTDNDQEYYYNDGEPVNYNDDSDEYSDSDEEEYNGWY